MDTKTILLVGDDRTFSTKLIGNLHEQNVKLVETPDPENALKLFKTDKPILILINSSRNSFSDGLDLAYRIRSRNEVTPIILVTKNSSEKRAIAALRAGINDYFKLPFSFEELLQSIKKQIAKHNNSPQNSIPLKTVTLLSHRKIIGYSRSMQEIRVQLIKVAPSDCTVFITGETGTGKGLVASLIHQHSQRRSGPLIPVNCAALPDNLIESELFGYDKGAFTGASTNKRGKFEMANGGTIFLDEIGDMGPIAQSKILKTIEEKENYRLGSSVGRPLNVRVVSATNQNPERLLAEGKFRKDLFYRLNVARIHLPPLRDRKEDIPQFITYYVGEFNRRYKKQIQGFSDQAVNSFLFYHWPGNVRELRNMIEACFISASNPLISIADFPKELRRKFHTKNDREQNERDRLLEALMATKGNKTAAAHRLKWSRMTLYRKLSKYNLDLEQPSKRWA